MKNIGGVVMIKHAMDSIMSGESEIVDDDV
jgi:hypothetical protein